MQIQICDQSPLAVTAAQLQIAIASSLAGTPAEDVHVQPSRVSQPLSVPCLPPASSPAVNNNQRHLLALPSSGLTQPELDNALMRESLAWTLQQRLMLQEAPLLNTDLIATGRSLRQSTDPADVFAERIQQVVERIGVVIAAAPPVGGDVFQGLPQPLQEAQFAATAFPGAPLVSGAVAAVGAPTGGPIEVPKPLNGTVNGPLISGLSEPLGAAQPGRIEARLGAAAQAMGPADAQQETAQQQWRAAVSNLQALIDAAPMALAAAYAGPEGRRRLAGIEPGVPRLHFGSHKDNATYAKVPAFASLDAFLDDMEAATEKLEVLSAIGHDDWKVKGRRLQSSEISGEALSPATGHLLMLRSHMHSLISQAPGPEEAGRHARHVRRKLAKGSHHWNHRQLSESGACCCDSALQFEVLVGAATLQAASSAAALLRSQLPQIIASAQPGSCLAQASPPGLQQQSDTSLGCVATPVLPLAPAPAPEAPPQETCPGGAEPRGWRCSHHKQPYTFDTPAYDAAAPAAAAGLCGLVGVTNVLCGNVVLEAVAYEALVSGVCKPLCGAAALEPCALPLSVYAPGVAPLSTPYARAPAPAPGPPPCPGGSAGSWQCGSLAFDEATYTALLAEYPSRCTKLSAEALLCGGVLLSPEAESALANRSCHRVCDRPQPCPAAAAPAPAQAPEAALPLIGTPIPLLTFAQQQTAPPPEQPGFKPLICPDGSQGVATCQFGNRSAHVEGSWLFDALAAFSAGTCRQLKLQYTEMSLCGCNLYETQLLTAAQDGACDLHCESPTSPAVPQVEAPAARKAFNRQSTVLQQPFPAQHKYKPAEPQSPFLAAIAPPPASDLICPCDAQLPRSSPNITFTYADTCPPSDEVAVTPVLVYFQARVTFPDSVAATDADLASFVASSNDDSSGETCPCREDPLTAARSGKKLGAVQHVTRVDCASVLVTGYVTPASYAAKETQVTLSVLNGTVVSPCGGAFDAGQASTTVQMRPVPRLYPTNMALRDGQPVTSSATALFLLVAQRPIKPIAPADFLISGLFHNASVRTAPAPSGPAAWRVAVDLPPDFCGAARLGLADVTGVAALDDGLAACASAGGGAAVTFTRLCGGAGRALVPVVGSEIVDPLLAGGRCLAPSETQ